jgi:hypothetical protein
VIGASANAAEPGLSAGRVLTGHKAYPCREFPPRTKMPAIVNRSHERRCDHWPDPRQSREATARFIRPANRRELSIEVIEPEIEAAEFIEHVGKEFTCEV